MTMRGVARRRARLSVAVAAVAAVVGCLALGARGVLAPPTPTLACRVLANGVVPLLAAHDSRCPLRAYDRVLESPLGREGARSASVAVRRRGSVLTYRVPTLLETRTDRLRRLAAAAVVASLLLGTALLIFWSSPTSASVALVVFYTALSISLIAALTPSSAPGLVHASSIAVALAPAALIHLALTFPREREILRRRSRMLLLPYGGAVLVAGASLLSLERFPGIWASADRLALGLGLAAIGLLAFVCTVAVREAESPAARARARLALLGVLAAVIVPAGVGIVVPGREPGGVATLVFLGGVVFPLPTGYAIGRFHLFDLRLEARRALGALLVPAAGAVLLVVGALALHGLRVLTLPNREPLSLFALLYVVLGVGELLRAPLRERLEPREHPRHETLKRAAEAHVASIAPLRDPDACARALGHTVRRTLRCTSVLVLIGDGDHPRRVYAEPSSAAVPGGWSGRTLEQLGEPVHLVEEGSFDGLDRRALRAAGLAVVAPLRRGLAVQGLLLVGGADSGRPYSSAELGFLSAVCTQTAFAIHNAELARGLVTAERFAAIGRLGASRVHDLGKPLGVLERLAQRLAGCTRQEHRLRRDSVRVAELAREARTILRSMVAPLGATGSTPNRCLDGVAVDDVLAEAIRAARPLHEAAAIRVRIDPDLPRLRGAGEELVRALTNLIDNALLASREGDAVEILARAEGGAIRIEVLDRGRGMTPEVSRRACDPLFTTRAGRGGMGLGLSLARDIVTRLGGRLRLESSPGAGTRASIRLPVEAARGELRGEERPA